MLICGLLAVPASAQVGERAPLPVVSAPPAPAPATLSAPAADTVTLDEAARRAVNWHPSVTEAIARLNAQAEEVDVAKAGYKPEISVGVGSGYDNAIGGNTRWRPRANVSAAQMLFDFGKVSSAVAIAEAGTQVTRAQVLLAVDTLIRDTSYAVIEIQRGEALRGVAEAQLASIQSVSELVSQRYQKGAATKSDALQAQARVQSAQATISQIEAERQRWQSNLAYLLGRADPPPVSAEVPAWFLHSCDQPEPFWADVPAIVEARAERQRALAEVRQARADGLPTVSLGAGAATDINDPFTGRTDYNFGINVSSSLSRGGATKARTRGAGYAVGAADAAEARVRNEVGRRLSEAQTQIASFTQVVDTLVARQDSMAETGKLYRLQYLEMGTRTLVDLLNAEQEFHQVRFELVNTVHDLRRLQVDCLFASGASRDRLRLSGTKVGGIVL